MLKDKDNLAYQAFPWSLVRGAVMAWFFVFGVLYLYLLGLLRGFSLALLPEGVSPLILLALPVQGLVLLILVLRIRYMIRKSKAPAYLQILISLILTVTTAFSVFVVLSYRKEPTATDAVLPDILKVPYDISASSGVNQDAHKYPVVLPEKVQTTEKIPSIKRSSGDFQTEVNEFFRPLGRLCFKILENKLLFMMFYMIPAIIISGFVNRYLLKKQYKDEMKVSFWRLSLIWVLALAVAIPFALFSEVLIGLAIFPGLGNILTITEIRRNIKGPIEPAGEESESHEG